MEEAWTRIEISEEARVGLNRYASQMKQRLGKRVTFDDAIKELLSEAGRRAPGLPTVERRRGWRKGKQPR